VRTLTRIIGIVSLFLFVSGGHVMGQASVRVWATGDGVRVNPETGRYLEDRTDIHKDYPTGDYRKHNAVWDASRRRVKLHAARNEFVAFQVVVETDKPVSGIKVQFDHLAGPGGARIAGKHVALFKAWYVHVAKHSGGYPKMSLGPGWYPDALLPADGRAVSFDIPDPRNCIGATQHNQTIWVDIYVPRERSDAPPGNYSGRLVVSFPGGTRELAVELGVWDFALPDEIHCRGDIWNGTLKRMTPQQELRWYQMTHRHRFQPGVAYYRPGLKVQGTKVTIDWSDYDKRIGKYLDGSAFTDAYGYWGPGYGVPIAHILLPFDCNKPGRRSGGWPASMPEGGPTPQFEAVWVETGRQIQAHFDADPRMRRVRKIVFLGGLDESYNEAAYEQMIYYCKLLRRGLGKDWFQYRIDGGYNWKAMEKLHPYVGLWVCHTAGFDAKKVAHFRKKGVEPWFYGPMIYERRGNSACGSNTFTDLDLLTCRGVGWVAWKHRSGFCEWEFDAFYDATKKMRRPQKPWEKAWTKAMNCRYGGQEYNGSGLLIYRGALSGSPDPIPSIRLKAHRRGFQDYEYFRLLKQAGKGGEADRLVDTIVTTVPFGRANYTNTDIWKHNPEAWDGIRIQAGKMLSAGASR